MHLTPDEHYVESRIALVLCTLLVIAILTGLAFSYGRRVGREDVSPPQVLAADMVTTLARLDAIEAQQAAWKAKCINVQAERFDVSFFQTPNLGVQRKVPPPTTVATTAKEQ